MPVETTDDVPMLPYGQDWLNAAKRSDTGLMLEILEEHPQVMDYRGKGCSLGFIGHSALHWAACKGHLDCVKWLLGHGAKVNLLNNAQSTALHAAVSNGQPECVEELLKAGADKDLQDADGSTARQVAVDKKKTQELNLIDTVRTTFGAWRIIEQMGLDENAWKIGEMKKALKAAGVDASSIVEKDELKTKLKDFIANNPKPERAPPPPAAPKQEVEKPVEKPKKEPKSPKKPEEAPKPPQKELDLGSSSEDEDDQVQGELLKKQAQAAKEKGNEAFKQGDFKGAIKHFTLAIRLDDKDHIFYSNRSGAYASMGDHKKALEDAEKCIELSPDWPKGYGRKGAAYVVAGEYKPAIKAYKAGLKLDPENGPLKNGLNDVLDALMEGKAPELPSEVPKKPAASNTSDTPGASASNNTAPTSSTPAPSLAPAPAPALAPAPAPAPAPSCPASSGQRRKPSSTVGPGSSAPLRWIEASKTGDLATMKDLYKETPDVLNAKARGIGHTALHWAAAKGETKMMTWLMDEGLDVNTPNNSDSTALHTAAGNGQAFSVELLLARGADVTIKNDNGETAADLAMGKNRPDLAKLVESHRPKPPTDGEQDGDVEG